MNATATEQRHNHLEESPDVHEERRALEILEATTALEMVLREWEEIPGQESPTWPFYEKAIALLKAWERGALPLKYLAQLARAEAFFEALDRHFAKHQDRFTNVMPSRQLFSPLQELLEGMREEIRTAERPPLESVHELILLPQISRDQICRMTGLTHLELEMELKTPGSVCTKDWVSPTRKKEEEAHRALSLAEVANASTGAVLRTVGAKIRAYEAAGLFSNT